MAIRPVISAITVAGLALALFVEAPALGQSESIGEDASAEDRASTSDPRISYQGRLTDGSGQPISDGTHNVTFQIYTSQTGGQGVWSESQTVQTTDGVFSAELGSNSSLAPLAFDQTYYLGVSVDGGSEFSPRTRLTEAPYAMRAYAVDDGAVDTDQVADEAITGTKLADDAIEGGTNVTVSRQQDGSIEVSSSGGSQGSGWTLSGNSGTNPGTDFLGTTDDKALEIKVGGARVVRLEPTDSTANVLGGHPGNGLTGTGSPKGVTIAGGGSGELGYVNEVGASYGAIGGGRGNLIDEDGGHGTVAGGLENEVLDTYGTVGGGRKNTASDAYASVGGGESNVASGHRAVVAGGGSNTASAANTTVSGGSDNEASADRAVVAGGEANTASHYGAAVGGGRDNVASGAYATVPGGYYTHARGDYSFAVGYRARAAHSKTFVFGGGFGISDSLVSTDERQFLIEADNGVGIGTNDPANQFHVRASAGGAAYTMAGHIASFENTATSSPDVLALEIGESGDPGTDANFLSFIDGDGDLLGEVQGNGSGGVQYSSSGADFAEMMPVRPGGGDVAPGDLVGVRAGAVGLETQGADRVMVVTDRPALLGNAGAADSRTGVDRVPVSFVGQVPVRVRGRVRAGDLLVPSGREDGTARAVDAASYDPVRHGPIVGQAWTSTTRGGVETVTAVVGLDGQQVTATLLRSYRDQLRRERARNDRQQAQIDRLRRELRRLSGTRRTAAR